MRSRLPDEYAEPIIDPPPRTHSPSPSSVADAREITSARVGVQPRLQRSAALAQAIRLHPANPHYFQFRGRPTLLVTSGEHYGAVLNPDFDYRTYLQTLARDGLNFTRIFTGSYFEPQGAFGIRKNTLAPDGARALTPWARSATPGFPAGGNRFDLARWDDAYFRRLRDFVRLAGEHGVVVEVTLFSSIYGDAQWAINPLNPAGNVNGTDSVARQRVHTLQNGDLLAHQERMVRKIVRELNAFDNVIYEIQNEPWADNGALAGAINSYLPDWEKEWKNRVEAASDASLAWQARIAAVVRDEEASLPSRHLIAQNYGNFRFALPSVDPPYPSSTSTTPIRRRWISTTAGDAPWGSTRRGSPDPTTRPTAGRRGGSSSRAARSSTTWTTHSPRAAPTAPTPTRHPAAEVLRCAHSSGC